MDVVELFAGVGGFRLGLEAAGGYRVVWWNQWEPSIKAQHAASIYARRFHDGEVPRHANDPIGDVPASAVPSCDLIVGGLPCQDYSVAATLDKSRGITGKKGVLWWDMHRLIEAKRPRFVLIENVDRLLKSPVGQRGRDFGIMLACLRRLGYVVEWRVVKASDYGAATTRRRVFVLAARSDTAWGHRIASAARTVDGLATTGFFAQAFPCLDTDDKTTVHGLPDDVADAQGFQADLAEAGAMIDGVVFTRRVEADAEQARCLADVVGHQDDAELYLGDVEGWQHVKGGKALERRAANGHAYVYREGAVAFPDHLDRPARTILTGEGARSPNRSTHVVEDPGGGLRLLAPEEAERVMGFPAGWTEGAPKRWRYFCMGNALVVQLVERIGRALMDGPAPAGLSRGAVRVPDGLRPALRPMDAAVQRPGHRPVDVDHGGLAEPWPGIMLPWTLPIGSGTRRNGSRSRPLCPVCKKATVALGHKDGAKSQWRFMSATVGREVVMCREHGLFVVRRLDA